MSSTIATMSEFSKRIRAILESREKSGYWLAKEAGISNAHVTNILGGKRPVGDDSAKRIAKALGLDLATVMAWVNADRLGVEGLDGLQKHVIRQISEKRDLRSGKTTVLRAGRQHKSGISLMPVWRIPCGEGTELLTDPVEHREFPVLWSDMADAVMDVVGTSMEACGFIAGDQLFVRRLEPGDSPTAGKPVIVRVDGNWSCKIYRNDDLGEYLESAPGDGPSLKIKLRAGVDVAAQVVGHYRAI